jgi:hypothetical protein
MASSRYYPGISLERLRKNHEKPVRIGGDQTEIEHKSTALPLH